MTKKSDEAKADYLAGLTYKEIAERYSVSVGTVRAWKSRYKWDGKSESQVSATNATQHATESATKRNSVAMQETLDATELTEKQKLFCLYYMQRFNAGWAYHKVYGVDWNTARAAGSRLLTNVKVKQELDRLKRLNEEQLHATQLDVTRKVLEIAFSDLGDYVHFGSKPTLDDHGHEYQRSYVYFSEQDEVDTSQIKEIHIGQNGPEIKLNDRLKALELLYKMLPEPVGQSAENDSMIEAIKEGINRLKGGQDDNGIAEKEG